MAFYANSIITSRSRTQNKYSLIIPTKINAILLKTNTSSKSDSQSVSDFHQLFHKQCKKSKSIYKSTRIVRICRLDNNKVIIFKFDAICYLQNNAIKIILNNLSEKVYSLNSRFFHRFGN